MTGRPEIPRLHHCALWGLASLSCPAQAVAGLSLPFLPCFPRFPGPRTITPADCSAKSLEAERGPRSCNLRAAHA